MKLFFDCCVMAMVMAPAGLGQTESPLPSPKVVIQAGDVLISDGAIRHVQTTKVSGMFKPLAESEIAATIAKQHLIDQAIAFDYLKQQPEYRAIDVVGKLRELDDELKRAEQSLTKQLKRQGRLESDLKFELRWRDAWKKHTDRLTADDDRFAQTLQKFGKRFDGTQVKVAQILLRTNQAGLTDEMKQQKSKLAAQLYKQLQQDPGLWDALVKQHSESPNRDHPETPGWVGWLGFQGPMPLAFSQRAFELAETETTTDTPDQFRGSADSIGRPVQTAIGWHIIRYLGMKPGTLSSQYFSDKLRELMIQQEFQRILNEHKAKVPVKER